MTIEEFLAIERRSTLAETRRAVAHAFTHEHRTFTPETEGHFRAAFLAIPDTTPEMWATELHRARNRYWRLTHGATGEQREVEAYTLDGALVATGWQLAECSNVEGPRGRSFAAMDAALAACGAALADEEYGALAEARLELGEERSWLDRDTDTDGLPYGYGRG